MENKRKIFFSVSHSGDAAIYQNWFIRKLGNWKLINLREKYVPIFMFVIGFKNVLLF